MTLTENNTVSRRSDVLWRVAPSYLVIATLDGDVHEAYGPAGEIWQAISQPIAVGRLVDSLARDFGVPPGQIRDETVSFLDELVATGLVDVDA